jgi:ADP-ribosylglycohydrolase
MRTLPPDYPERAYAAVLGKLIGVYLGRPFEGWTYQRIMRELGPIEGYVHERLACPLVVTDDDIAGTFTFIRALEDHSSGSELTAREIGETWLNYIVENRAILWWGGNGNSTEHTAWLNLRRGIEARLAEQAARVSHDGVAVDAAKFWAAMEAEAFVSRDVERLIGVGLAQIDASSPIAKLIADIRRWRRQYSDWRDAREAIEARYGYDKYPGNCHVVPNHALMIMALLYAPDDFCLAQTIVCTSGWDTDCNAGNVGCLMGAMLGLEGLGAGRDWRGPIADRMLISSADGGGAINDAVRVSARLVDIARKLAGLPPQIAPKHGAQFHFSPPGSVQGFMPADGTARLVVENAPLAGAGALRVRYAGLASEPAAVLTPTFAPPEVTRMRTYDLMATPLVYPGQIVRARVVAEARNAAPVSVGLRALVYGADDALAPLDSAPFVLSPGAETILSWRLPDTGGEPIQSIGLVLRSGGAAADGAVTLDYLRWDGPPELRLRRPDAPGDFWRRAWVNAVAIFSTHFPQAFRISQDRGEGLIIHGGRQWTDYRLETALTVHLAEHAGVGVRVQGLRRYYAMLLVRPDRVRLVRVHDGVVTILAESFFAWSFETPYEFVVQACGAAIEASVGGVHLRARDESPLALADGGVALILKGGACSCDTVLVTAPDSAAAAADNPHSAAAAA